MRRFWLFTYDTYEALGGFRDFHSDHDTVEDAVAAKKWENYHVFDSEQKKIVAGNERIYETLQLAEYPVEIHDYSWAIQKEEDND